MKLPLVSLFVMAALSRAGTSLANPVGAMVSVANAGFEEGAVAWENGPAVVSVEKHSGLKSLSLAKGHVFQSMGSMIRVEPGGDYRLKVWIKTGGCESNGVAVCALWRAQDARTTVGAWIEGAAPAFIMDNGQSPVLAATGGTHDWQEFTAVIPAQQIPSEARYLHVYLRHDLLKNPAGKAFFDDIAAERFPAGTLAPNVIVRNGDFEKGKAGWWGEGTWAVEKGAGVSGTAALRLNSGFVCQDKRQVEGRKCYRITMKIRSEGAAEGAVYVQTSYRGAIPISGWFGPERVKLGGRTESAVFVTGGTHDWKSFSVVVRAPPAADQLLLYLRKQAGPGAAFFDDIRVEPTDEKPVTAADKQRDELAATMLTNAPAGTVVADLLAAAIALGAKPVPAKWVMADTGKALCHIHVNTKADIVTLGAAKALAGYLQQISGAEFSPISHDTNPASGPLLVVGRDSVLAARLCPDIVWERLGPDGFIIRSVGGHLVIAGATSRGTMYGVNWFLDHKLGVRWYSPQYTRVPTTPTLELPPLSEEQVPHFSYREVLSAEGSSAAFAAHNLLNGRSHGPSFSSTAPEIDCWEHDWMSMGGSANFMELLPQKTYGKEHPEWFVGGQVTMMDKALRAEMAKVVIKRLRGHSDYTTIWYNIWQMDWGWDMDPASKAFADAHGGLASAPRLDMMIDIADQVRAVLPGARMAMQAYSWGFTPPPGMTVPDYLLVFPMTIHVDYSTPLNKGRNEKLGADIVGWTKIAKNVQVWDHIANWAGFIQPTPNLIPIGESIQWLSTVPGIRGYFCEGNWNSPGGEFGSLRAWMIARMTWDPKQDPKALIDDYCAGYYGKAGPMVRAYIDLEHVAAARSGDILGQRYMPDLPMYDLDFVMAADRLFDQAELAVSGDTNMLAHVLQARMPVDYVILVRRAEYAAAAAKRGASWTVDAVNRRARFNQGLVDNKIREYRQGGGLKELAALLDVERQPSTPNPRVKGLPAKDWVDIQDLAFMRFDTAMIVNDAAASDGAAIQMSGKSSTWAIQLPVERVPKDGEWDLYADVRVVAEPGHDDEPGVRVGSSPPMGLFNTGTIKELNDGRYHLIKVPGGPHHFIANDRLKSIYLQSPAKSFITHIYLDRIVAIRHVP